MDNFTDVLLLVQLIVIIILSVFVHRSYPTGKIEDLFKQAEKLATATSTEIDDVTLTVARYLHNLILSPWMGEK